VDGSSSCNPADDAPPESFSNGVSSETEGFKWSLTAFRKWLSKREGQRVMETTFDRIFDLCLKTMIAAESEITPYLHQASNFRTNCFELFGCDVILDSNLNPHLLEVNVSPSLMGSSPLDKKIKGTVIADIFHIVGIYPHDSKLLKKYSRPQSAGVTAPLERGSDSGNPFAYSSLSKMMASQGI
jgi:tubulin polyglutamylase TTLL4